MQSQLPDYLLPILFRFVILLLPQSPSSRVSEANEATGSIARCVSGLDSVTRIAPFVARHTRDRYREIIGRPESTLLIIIGRQLIARYSARPRLTVRFSSIQRSFTDLDFPPTNDVVLLSRIIGRDQSHSINLIQDTRVLNVARASLLFSLPVSRRAVHPRALNPSRRRTTVGLNGSANCRRVISQCGAAISRLERLPGPRRRLYTPTAGVRPMARRCSIDLS